MRTATPRALLCFATFAALTLLTGIAHAQAPNLLSLQGYLTDTDGTPIDGEHTLSFALYDPAGNTVYSEVRTLTLEGGVFTAYVGQSGLDLATFRDHGDLELGIAIDGDPELTPRYRIATAPFAAYAEYAGSAASVTGGVDWSALNNVPADLGGDGDTLAALGCGQFDIPKFINGQWTCASEFYGLGTLSGLSCAAGEVASFDGTNWTCSAGTLGGLSCGANQVAKADGAGGWSCANDDGLDLAFTDNRYVNEGQADAINGTMIADNSINAVDIATGAVATAELLDGTVAAADLNTGLKGDLLQVSDVYQVTATTNNIGAAGSRGTVSAQCTDNNDIVLSGSCWPSTTDDVFLNMQISQYTADTTQRARYVCTFTNIGTDPNIDVNAEVYCLTVP